MTFSKYLPDLLKLTLEAGAKISEIYATDFDVETKGDGSAVTQADKLGEEIILQGLKNIAPDIPVLAEEEASAGNIPELGETFFLVDPLDGTREFVNKTGEFTVNIALIHEQRPVLGVVYAPGANKLYYGVVGEGAWVRMVPPGTALGDAAPGKAIHVRPKPYKGLVAVASRSHRTQETEDYMQKIGAANFTPAGSSLKFCLVAEGLADVYPRFGRTMEWDTGAAQAVLEAAGGRVMAMNESGEETGRLLYRKEDRGYDNPYFVAWGGA